MQEKIKELYLSNIQIIDLADQAVLYFRRQNYDKALRITTSVLSNLEISIRLLVDSQVYFTDIYNMEWIVQVLNQILNAQEQQDYVLLADLLEGQLLPLIEQYQTYIVSNETILFDEQEYARQWEKIIATQKEQEKLLPDISETYSKGYGVEYTSSGLYTVSYKRNGQAQYIHSNNHPMKEAFTIADSWYSEDKIVYIVYGLGLGYHIQSLAEIDDNITIEVYEQDINMIALFCAFGNCSRILDNKNIKIIYDPTSKQLYSRIKDINETEEFVIYAPSLRLIPEDSNREKLENFFLQYSSYKNQSKLLKGNFRSNINHYDYVIDELKEDFKDKDIFIIAAGPSLDKNFLQLKKRRKDSIILATGTVFYKLVHAGIQPDYVIVTDANQRVVGQISGNEENKAKLIFLATAYKGFALSYKSEKIIVFQKDFESSEQYANENGYKLYQTGGSVSTLALDISIQLGCKRVIFLGLDLGYTNNYVHAENTSRRILEETKNLRQVKDIEGKLIYTSKSLDAYRKWIERRIKDVTSTEIIDATEGGAFIQGMKILPLNSIIE